MKKALIIIVLILFGWFMFSCKSDAPPPDDAVESVTVVENEPEEEPEVIIDATDDTEIEPEAPKEYDEPDETEEEGETEIVIDTPEPEQSSESISLTLLTDKLYFYDGEFVEQSNINPVNCGIRCFTDGNQRIFYDEHGDIVSSESLIVEPDFILGDWIIENVSPEEAQAGGALFTDYSRIFFQGVEQDFWFMNQWKATDLIQTISGDIIAIEGNIFHPLTDVSGISHAKNLLIHDFDAINRTAIIETNGVYAVSWLTNYFNQAKDWLQLNGVWYSQNGYEFETDLIESANALWSWNTGPFITELPAGQQPTVLWAGIFENGLFGIECNTGTLFKYTPESDTLEALISIYSGDGYRTTGLLYIESLMPVIVQGKLYFYDGSIWELDLESGIVGLFFGGAGEVAEW